MMPIRFSPSSLKEGRWYEYLIRFALGGTATVFAGLVSSRYGASIGGLFLALPAIFCASATLIEKHEIRRKREAGLAGERRGRTAAAVDSAGAALGALGMLAFAMVFSLTAETSIAAAFIGASLAWLVISMVAWYVRRKTRSVRRGRTEQKGGRLRDWAKPLRSIHARARRLPVHTLAQRNRIEFGVRRLLTND
ncbi:hypothetical protein ABIF50_005651 [Bradyrhizobium diazoefficiens]